MYRLVDYGSMLRDERRIDAYRRALSAVLSPTSIVLDIGSGLGTFSIVACQLGAARVYAIEAADVILIAAEVARANGVADRIQFIHSPCAKAELPERVDVIVSDLSGALPLFEEHIPTIMYAREEFLKPGGVLIPTSDRLLCAPVSSVELYGRITDPWLAVAGIDYTPAAAMSLHAAYALPVRPDDLAAPPQCWAELDYRTITSPNVSGSLSWSIPAGVLIHGLALWSESTLHGDLTIASGPWSVGSVHSTMVLPLLAPVEVEPKETLHVFVEATLVGGRYVTTWQVGTDRQPGKRQSTFFSEPGGATAAREPMGDGGTNVSLRATFHVPESVLSRPVGVELVLLHLASGVYHVLNSTGARVWELLLRGETVESIVAVVASEYEVEEGRAAADVIAVVAQLQAAELIVADA